MRRSRRSSPALPTFDSVISNCLIRIAGLKEPVGRMPLFKFL